MTSISFPDAPPSSTPSGEFYQTSFVPPPAPTPQTNGQMPAPQSQPQSNSSNQQQYYMPGPTMMTTASTTSFEDEPPLLEELGINLPSVISKVKLVANPFSKIDSTFSNDADMTGPVLLCLLLGFLLLLQRKIQFGVIYGQATFGCITIYLIFNLMSKNNSGIDLYRATSILGYSLLPMVILSFFAVFIPITKFKVLGICLGVSCIFWSTTMATKIFVAVLSMDDQFWLVWYPLSLLYTSFAFITIF